MFIPLIQEIVVDGFGWVTHKEFIDGIALGQVTPVPILICAAVIGYKMAGLLGTAAETIGIVTSPALVMIISTRYLERINKFHLTESLYERHTVSCDRYDFCRCFRSGYHRTDELDLYSDYFCIHCRPPQISI